MAYFKELKGFALSKKFLHETVFPKYPDIFEKIQAESLRIYKKQIFKQLNEERKNKIHQMNKKSVYRHVTFIEKDDNFTTNNDNNNKNEISSINRETKNKILAEKIVSQNLNENIGEI